MLAVTQNIIDALLQASALIAALGILTAPVALFRRKALRRIKTSVANADVLVNGREEERAPWNEAIVLAPAIKPAASRLDDMEAAIATIRAEVTPNGGGSLKDAVSRIELRQAEYEKRRTT